MATQHSLLLFFSFLEIQRLSSFCGVDTRKNFTGHLYTAVEQKAIEKSKYAIIVLSTNYAFSRWCLIELAKIVECMKETKLTVLLVFYHVDPSDVRNKMGTLAQAFEEHEKDPKVNKDDIQAWKVALKEVGNISGWHLHDRDESKIIRQIFERIFNDLNGICGMGGMGKTTLARKIYQRISSSFEASSFIANVREETRNQHLVCLQKQLLSKILMESKINIWDFHEGINVLGNRLRNKKVLIILDDVDEEEQLEALARNHDWFGLGSRIIVTSRDSHLLRRRGVNDIYTVKGLNNDDALQLFSWRAFKKPYLEENYVDLSKDLVNYAKGLPLALKVLDYNLGVLMDKSLITINENGTLWMHDLLQEMGQEIGMKVVEGIVINTPNQKEEHLNSKAFSKMKKLRLLKINNVEPPKGLLRGNVQLPQCLSHLSNELHVIEWHGYPLNSLPTSFQPIKLVELKMHCSLIKQLWKGIMNLGELKLIDLSDSQTLIEIPNLSGAPNLKKLILRCCTRLYKIHASLGNLKWLIQLDLNGCKCLESLPHKINLEALEILDLGHGKNLSTLLNTTCSLSSLKTLTLSGCSKLHELPENLGNIKGLKKLDVSRTAIRRLPSSIVHLKNLRKLSVRLLPKLPLNIKYIGADGCISLETLPARLEDNFLYLHLLNCVKLVDNEGYDNLFLTMLRHDFFKRPDRYSICVLIPGNNIPKWFSHQTEGASLNLQGPSDFLGIALCTVYNGETGFTEEFGKIDSYHLWLRYFPIKFFEGKLGKKLIEGDADISQIELRFGSEGPGLEVVKCGARLVYTEDLNQTMAVCSSCNITPYEADFEDLVEVTKMKRSSDNYDGDEAGPSGEDIPSDVDIPHPKRIKFPNLIERFIPRLGNLIGNLSTQVKGDSDCKEEESSDIGSFHE
ncbi:disease resistance protein RUN1-like [Quercus suber]|uniref:disease resistance protein RUN1-like n=1 Tax=Quercus suber TaxID=58331 RepID=UPI0032DF539C